MSETRKFKMKLFDITDGKLVITTAENYKFEYQLEPAMYKLMVEKCRELNKVLSKTALPIT